MRGRTNLLGFDENFINGYIDQYQVKAGNRVVAGDFVQLFSQADSMKIMDKGTEDSISGYVQINESYFLILFSNGTNSTLYRMGWFNNVIRSTGGYVALFKINNGEIEYIKNVLTIGTSSVADLKDILCIDSKNGYVYISSGYDTNVYAEMLFSVYKFDEENEDLILIKSKSGLTLPRTFKFLDDTHFISGLGWTLLASSTNYPARIKNTEFYSISIDEINNDYTLTKSYTEPDNSTESIRNTFFGYDVYIVSPSGNRVAVISIYKNSSSNTGYGYNTPFCEYQKIYVYDYDSSTGTLTKHGIYNNGNYNLWLLGQPAFIDENLLLAQNAYQSYSSFSPQIILFNLDTLVKVKTKDITNDNVYGYYSYFYQYGTPSAPYEVIKERSWQYGLPIKAIGNQLVFILPPLPQIDGVSTPSPNKKMGFMCVEVNETGTDITAIVGNVFEFSIDSVSDYAQSANGFVMQIGSKYIYIFAFDNKVLTNEVDLSELPVVEFTSAKPKLVQSYVGKISGVAKTSGNAGEVISVFVPNQG